MNIYFMDFTLFRMIYKDPILSKGAPFYCFVKAFGENTKQGSV